MQVGWVKIGEFRQITRAVFVEPPAKISDPPAAIKKTQGGDFLCTYALARSSTSIAKTSTPLMKFDKYSPANNWLYYASIFYRFRDIAGYLL